MSTTPIVHPPTPSPRYSDTPSSPTPAPADVVHNCADLCTFAGVPAQANLPPLSDAQLAAIDLLVLGRSDTAVARRLSLHCNTIHNWKTSNRGFRAELSHRRNLLWSTAADRYRRLLLKSARVFDRQLSDAYNPTAFRAAYAILQMSAYFCPVPDPDPFTAPAPPAPPQPSHNPNSGGEE